MTLHSIRRSLIAFLLFVSAYGMADPSSWKIKTKESLKFLYEQIKENHPEGQNLKLRLGRAYGMSLDKVKFVEDENQFRHAMVDFVNILSSDCTDIVVSNEASSLSEREKLFTVALPHGNLTFIVFKYCQNQ
jgi:hypothetical protein